MKKFRHKCLFRISKRRVFFLRKVLLNTFFFGQGFYEIFFTLKIWHHLQLPLKFGRLQARRYVKFFRSFNSSQLLTLYQKRVRLAFVKSKFKSVYLNQQYSNFTRLFCRYPIKQAPILPFQFISSLKLIKKNIPSLRASKSFEVRKRLNLPRESNRRLQLRGFFIDGIQMVKLIQKLYYLKRKHLALYALRSPNELLFCKFLEFRLDVLLFRIGFFPSVILSRRAIIFCAVFVNFRNISMPSFQLKIGDCISLSLKGRFIIFYYLFIKLLSWRRNYYYTSFPFSNRIGSNSIEVDFYRLRALIFCDIFCYGIPTYRYKSRDWHQSRSFAKKHFQVGFDYSFLYRFLLRN
jgi:ribosomal protein S4